MTAAGTAAFCGFRIRPNEALRRLLIRLRLGDLTQVKTGQRQDLEGYPVGAGWMLAGGIRGILIW